ncbi:MAG: hypothetical protein AB7O56_14085 [Bauldia sp.]
MTISRTAAAAIFTAVALVIGEASAQDPLPTTMSGYVDVRTAFGITNLEIEGGGQVILEAESRDRLFGGAARVSVPIGMRLAIQLDAWGGYAQIARTSTANQGPPISSAFSTYSYGAGAHLVLQTDRNIAIGALATAGRNEDQWFGNVGLETAADLGAVRLGAQATYTFGFGPEAYEPPHVALRAGATYYAGDRLSIGANAGADWAIGAPGRSFAEWGGRVEFMPAATPVAIYLGYRGSRLLEGTELSEAVMTGPWRVRRPPAHPRCRHPPRPRPERRLRRPQRDVRGPVRALLMASCDDE